MARNVEDIRNIAVCGHGSSGKTTLVDHLLVKTGAVTGQPSVDNGTSICDFDEEEKHHKHSVEASIVHFDHAGKRFNVIDTPGYPGSHRPDDRRAAGRGNGRHRDRRPCGHQGEHAPRVAGSGRRRAGPDPVHHQAGHRQHQLSGAHRFDQRSVRHAMRAVQRADRPRARSEGRRQHARRAEGHGRRADRSGRRSANRSWNRSSRRTKR